MSEDRNDEHTLAVVTVVSAYVQNNPMPSSDVPVFIRQVSDSLKGLDDVQVEAERPAPAVPIKKSVTPDYIICLEDGKKFKSLKRHLRTHYDLTPEQYRERWGLKPDYPMVAPNYAKARSDLAKQMGLGQRGDKSKQVSA